METNLLGACGRYGAGKSTLASTLTQIENVDIFYSTIEVNNRLDYITSILFGFDIKESVRNKKQELDPIWGNTFEKCKQIMFRIIFDHIHPALAFDLDIIGAWGVTYFSIPNKIKSKWIELSLANTLKVVSSVIFDIDCITLLGLTDESRKNRDTVKTWEYIVCGSLTGRQCLEYFGTDVMRNNFDINIWIKILERDISKYRSLGYNIIIPDVRYSNEKEMIDRLGGKLIIIYRIDDDLVLTEKDKEGHQAGWRFLEFISKNSREIYLKNDKSIEEFKSDIGKLFNPIN
jgi:hypothetical protein